MTASGQIRGLSARWRWSQLNLKIRLAIFIDIAREQSTCERDFVDGEMLGSWTAAAAFAPTCAKL